MNLLKQMNFARPNRAPAAQIDPQRQSRLFHNPLLIASLCDSHDAGNGGEYTRELRGDKGDDPRGRNAGERRDGPIGKQRGRREPRNDRPLMGYKESRSTALPHDGRTLTSYAS